MARKHKTNNSRRVRKKGEFFSFLVAAILIVGFFAASHYMFFGYSERKVASIPRTGELECTNLLPLLQTEDKAIRFRAAVAISSCGYMQGIDSLIGFLNENDEEFKQAAAFALLSQEKISQDKNVVSKIQSQKESINKIIHPNLSK